MQSPLSFFLTCFAALFTLVNPISAVPVVLAMTEGMQAAAARRFALRACAIGCIAMLLFATMGSLIFSFFSISLPSLKIVGGLLFLIMGYDMLQARVSRIETPAVSGSDSSQTDLALTPVAVPMICGPGAITAVIVKMQEARGALEVGLLLAAILAIGISSYLVISLGGCFSKVLGENGNRVFIRLMGLIVMMIAVEFFISGIRPILQPMR